MSVSGAATRWEAPDLTPPPPRAAPSVEELEAIERAARQEGFARGHAEGYAQGQAEVRRLIAQMEGLIDSFARPLAQLDGEVEAVLAELAVQVAGALLGRAYQAEPQLLADLVAEAVRLAGNGGREVEVRLHPDDLAQIKPLLAAQAGARLHADTTLARGDVRVHAEALRLDGSLSARLRSALCELTAARGETG